MPYIKQTDRDYYDPSIDKLLSRLGTVTAGELNYILTRIVTAAILGDHPNYADYNEAIGVLECVKLELYRRQVAAYEDLKISQNGDL